MDGALLRLLCAAAVLVSSGVCAPPPIGGDDPEIDAMLASMSLTEKVGQMTQIDVSLLTTDKKPSADKVRKWLSQYKVGSVLNSPYSGRDCDTVKAGWTPTEWRDFVRMVQEEAQRLGMPPVLFGLDSVHGANYVHGATIFGHQIALGATFDRHLAREVGFVTARDTLAAGVSWIFGPILGIATQPSWARVYETFGEDPLLSAELGSALIQGAQSDSGDPELPRAAACMKHFFAYSHPESGQDRTPTWLSDQQLRDYYLPPFAAAVKAGVATGMSSYNEINGVPAAASKKWTVDVLRRELGWEGMLVTDWGEIKNLYSFHGVAPSQREAVRLSMLRSSTDMSMVPTDLSFHVHLSSLVSEGSVPMERVDESARRVLKLKKWLGLLSHPVPSMDSPLIEKVGTDAELARRVARASVTLLKNERNTVEPPGGRTCRGVQSPADATVGIDVASFFQKDVADAESCMAKCKEHPDCGIWLFKGSWVEEHPDYPICYLKGAHAAVVRDNAAEGDSAGSCDLQYGDGVLPLDVSKTSRILLTGPTIDSKTYQAGGWSISWQGACGDADFVGGETISQGLRRLLPSSVDVIHTAGCTIHAPSHASATCDYDDQDMTKTLEEAGRADVIIIGIGEENYTEKPGDIDDLSLHEGQIQLVHRITDAAPSTPIILVLVEGRPRLLKGITGLPQVKAIVHAYLPGPEGGTAVAEVLLGETNPSGRLPITYHAFPNTVHNHLSRRSVQCASAEAAYLSIGTGSCPVLFPFGHGLSYTTFAYSHMEAAHTVIHPSNFTVTLTVKNTGHLASRHTVMLYVEQDFRWIVSPEVRRLVGFTQVQLGPGESEVVAIHVDTWQLSYTDENVNRLVMSGSYRLQARYDNAYNPALQETTVNVMVAGVSSDSVRHGDFAGAAADVYQGGFPSLRAMIVIAMVTGSCLTALCLAIGAALAYRFAPAPADARRPAQVVKRAASGNWLQFSSRVTSRNNLDRLGGVNSLTNLDRLGGYGGMPHNASQTSLQMMPVPTEHASEEQELNDGRDDQVIDDDTAQLNDIRIDRRNHR